MIDKIFIIKDIFYHLIEYISYRDIISISMLNLFLSERIKNYKKIDYIRSRIYQKYLQKKSSIHDLTKLNLISFIIKDKNIIIDSSLFRELFLNKCFFPGDILISDSEYYILDLDKIYSLRNYNERYIPKIIQKKYNLSRWTELSNIHVFVKIELHQFDFQSIFPIQDEYYTFYVRIWNHYYNVFMFVYIYDLDIMISESILSNEEWKRLTKDKIIMILNFPKFYTNINPIYYEKGDIKIFTWMKNSIYGWFLE